MSVREKKEILNELQISEDVYKELLGDFFVSAESHIEKLKQYLESEDFENARYVLHTIKGSSANLRLDRIVDAIESLSEEIKGSGNAGKISKKFEFLIASVNEAKGKE